MIKNYFLTVLNLFVAALPILFTWDLKLYFFYIGFLFVFILLFSWNPLGEIIILYILNAKKVSSNCDSFPSLNQYLKHLVINGFVVEQCVIYYSNINVSFCFPISRKKLIVPLNLEDRILNQGEQFLIKSTIVEIYTSALILSRKILLISIIGYVIVFRIIEMWAIFFAFAVKAILALVILLASGALFGSSSEASKAISFGASLGNIAVKINNIENCVQVSTINLILRLTMNYSIESFK